MPPRRSDAFYNPFKPSAVEFMQAFTKAGVAFNDVLRLRIPQYTLSPSQAAQAEWTMRKAATTASLRLSSASRDYLSSSSIRDAVVSGQREAAISVGLKFGGPNERLIERLRYDLAGDLGKASASPPAFVSKKLREATAYAKRRPDQLNHIFLSDVDAKISRSLVESAVGVQSYEKASKRLLKDLGLAAGNKVLFMSGIEMDAEVYSKLVVRTRSLEALNEAKAEEYIDNGYLYIETTEHEGVDPKDICFFLQGKVWALAPNPLGIPILPPEYGLPPWHPNCLHSYAAWQPQFNGGRTAIDSVLNSHKADAAALAKWQGPDGSARAYQLTSK